MVYTPDGDEVPFDWDEQNAAHVERHSATPDEVTQALLSGDRLFLRRSDAETEDRWVVMGPTDEGRWLVVVYTRRNGQIRVITAREPNAREAAFLSRRRRKK
ncbi:MAG: BrnT family toxin [Dehalococcoidia bacterium]|nr:BrnT family toxin [Dehalococcoidia bacterium]